jgi:hypothetical protein
LLGLISDQYKSLHGSDLNLLHISNLAFLCHGFLKSIQNKINSSEHYQAESFGRIRIPNLLSEVKFCNTNGGIIKQFFFLFYGVNYV